MMAISLGCSRLILLAVPGLFAWNTLTLMIPFLRMLIIVTLLLHLAMSTPAQVIMRLLQGLHLPGFVRLPLSVAIRFIPTFMDDCKQIGEAARLRPGKGMLSMWRCLAVPLVFRTLSSADDLAIAAELKGLSATGTCTAPNFPAPSRRDYSVLAAAMVTVVMAAGVQLWHTSSGGAL